jgi:hypothetical protein
MDEANLTRQEVRDLIDSILEGVDFWDGGDLPRASWVSEMQDWCFLLLDRLYERGGGRT